MAAGDGPGICDEGGKKGLIFPVGPDWEQSWPQWVKVVMYGLGLAWAFLGVAIIADVFMNAIETITSKKRRIFDKANGRYRTIKVWNETVANLTLMALGSSAPEILLNVVEVLNNDFFPGELGPGTIVGSAAFNLLCISAVCVASIPSGETRMIKDVAVYVVTAIFSLFAYVWMIFVLMIHSKDIVLLWEAVVTFLFFPVLVMISFAADKGWISGVPAMANRQRVVAAEMTKEEIAEIVKDIRAEFGDLDETTMQVLIEKRTAARPSKAAIRAEGRKKRAGNEPNNSKSALWGSSHSHKTADLGVVPLDKDKLRRTMTPVGQATVEFATSHYAVKESAKFIIAKVLREDNENSKVTVNYRTKPGTATAGKDYKDTQGQLEFAPGVLEREVKVAIFDDSEWEQAEDFHIDIYDPVCDTGTIALGSNYTTTVTIIDDDDPGCLSFENDYIQHDADESTVITLLVMRHHGCKGEISCQCKTEDDSAVAPLDYEAVDIRLVMKDGEMKASIPITVVPRGRYDCTERFRLILNDAKGCRFDATADGDEESTTCTIELKAGAEAKAKVDNLYGAIVCNWDKAKLGKDNWKEQFVEAMYAGGSADAHKEARIHEKVLHYVSLPWKLLFAFVPPTEFGGGWLCFFTALIMIGSITAAIGDLAMCFGCSLNFPNQITAITFVALGTSLPDTFASMTAATQDPFADASITNITGSNSVNVFLGLGVPWIACAMYWELGGATDKWRLTTPQSVQDYVNNKDNAVYALPADDLGFSVGVFVACAICAMAALSLRRFLFKGELGGPHIPKLVSAFYLVFLWFVYIAASWSYIEVTSD
jgi:solute carrier family 8 (sodium/calcium exchanger)